MFCIYQKIIKDFEITNNFFLYFSFVYKKDANKLSLLLVKK